MTSPRWALGPLLVLLLGGAGGCSGVLTATAAGRLERPTAGETAAGPAIQAAPAVRWEIPQGPWSGGIDYAPTLLAEAGRTPLVRQRATASLAPRRSAGLHPFGRLSVDYGTVRPGEMMGEGVLEPFPGGDVLRSYAVRSEGGLTGRLDRRTDLRISAGVDRSAGIDSAALTLPELTRTHVGMSGRHQRTRSQTLDASVQVERFMLGETSTLLEGDVRATFRLTEGLSVSATLGAAAASAPKGTAEAGVGGKPIAGLGATYSASGRSGAALGLSLSTRPAFDRLDGILRQRLEGQASLDAGLTQNTRVTTLVNWSADVSGNGPLRRILTADATLTTELPSEWRVVLGLRAFLQSRSSDSVATDPSEARLHLGLSRSWTLR